MWLLVNIGVHSANFLRQTAKNFHVDAMFKILVEMNIDLYFVKIPHTKGLQNCTIFYEFLKLSKITLLYSGQKLCSYTFIPKMLFLQNMAIIPFLIVFTDT